MGLEIPETGLPKGRICWYLFLDLTFLNFRDLNIRQQRPTKVYFTHLGFCAYLDLITFVGFKK